MMPKDLINLACREFPVFNLALEANPHSNNSTTICWSETPDYQLFIASPEDLFIAGEYSDRSMKLERLPSGLWAWIPSHPDDLALVAEYKRNSNQEFGVAKYIVTSINIIDRSNSQGISQAIQEAKRQTFTKLAEEVIEDRFYRMSFISNTESVTEGSGRLVNQVSYAVIYSEEVGSDLEKKESAHQ